MNDTTAKRELPLPLEEPELSNEFQTNATPAAIEVSPEAIHEEASEHPANESSPKNNVEEIDNSQTSSVDLDESSKELQDQARKEITEMKVAVLDSAELATQAAQLGVMASKDLKEATKNFLNGFELQKRNSTITLVALGTIVFITLLIFAIVSVQITSKVSQLDSMVLAVGKRVVSMDTSISNVNAASSMLTSMAKKQNEIIITQGILENKLEELMKSTSSAPKQPVKQSDPSSQAVMNLVKSLDTRLALQNKSINSISSQIQKLRTAVPQTSKMKQEIDALIKQQEELKLREASATAATEAIKQQRFNEEEDKKNMIRFPRVRASIIETVKK